MAIPDFVANAELTAAELNRMVSVLTPKWWKGILSAGKTTTSGQYTSLTFTSASDDEILAVTATSDSISSNTAGVFELSIRAWVSTVDSTGVRQLMVIKNPSANSVASSTNVTGTIIAHYDSDAEGDASPSMIVHEPRIRLLTTDKLLVVVYQNSGSTLTVSDSAWRTAFSLVYIGE